jgi:hypothetical protein
MVLDFWNRNSSLTLATGLVCGIGQSQRMALLRKTKTGKESSHLTAWWSGWRSMKILMENFIFFEAYACFSPLYQQVGKQLLSMKSIGSMDVECMARPFKHCIFTKDRNAPSNKKGIVLFRAGKNLKYLHPARKVT